MDSINQSLPTIIVSCIICVAVWFAIRFKPSPAKKSTRIQHTDNCADIFRPSIPSSFRTPLKENIMQLPCSSLSSKKKSVRSSRLSSPSCYGYDSGDSDSDQENTSPAYLHEYFEEEKSCPISVRKSMTPSFALTPASEGSSSRSPYSPSDAVRYVPAPISCTYRVTETHSRRHVLNSASSFDSEDEKTVAAYCSGEGDSPLVDRSYRGTKHPQQGPPALAPIEMPFGRSPSARPKENIMAWPESKRLDVLASKLLQKVCAELCLETM
jgi:hypothetical protein